MLNLQVSSASLFDCVGCKIGLVRASARFVIYVFLCVCIGYFIIGTVIGLFGIRGLYRQLGSVSQSAVIKCLGEGGGRTMRRCKYLLTSTKPTIQSTQGYS